MNISDANRVVIKVGSSSLTHSNGRPNFRKIEKLAQVICDLKNLGKQIILVSSGAIAVGTGRLNLSEKPSETRFKQAVAAIGQCDLMSIYDKCFSEYGYVTGQILLTRDVVENEKRKQNVINTIDALLELGVVPIINENDSVATDEIEFGDNDNLSAIVAKLSSSDLLVIMSDIEGYFDSDPRENADAHLLATVTEVTDEMIAEAGGSGTARGTGGMKTKLEAAKFANSNNIDVVIMSCERPQKLYDLFEDRSVGTHFCSKN